MIAVKPAYLIAAGAVLAAFAVSRMATKSDGSSWAGYLAEQTGAAVVDSVDGVLSGAVYGVGGRLGLPDTRQKTVIEQGRADLEAGNYWEASKNLPAGEFIGGVWSKIWSN